MCSKFAMARGPRGNGWDMASVLISLVFDVCNCVCVRRFNRWFNSMMQGAAGNVIVLQPTKTAMTFCDLDLGRQVNVPVETVE